MPHLAPDQCQFGGGAKADGFSAIKSGESGPSHAVVGEFGDDTPAAGGGIGGEVGATEGGFGGGDRIRQISTNEEGNVVDFPGMPHPTLGYLVCKTSFCSAGRWVKAHDIEHLALEAQPSATKLVPFGGIILGQPVTGNGGSPSSDLDVPSEAVRRRALAVRSASSMAATTTTTTTRTTRVAVAVAVAAMLSRLHAP